MRRGRVSRRHRSKQIKADRQIRQTCVEPSLIPDFVRSFWRYVPRVEAGSMRTDPRSIAGPTHNNADEGDEADKKNAFRNKVPCRFAIH